MPGEHDCAALGCPADPELDKLAAKRAGELGISVAEARTQLLATHPDPDVQVLSTDPPVAVVSSAAIGAAGTLDAGYWINHRQGEDPPAYRRRLQALECIRRAEAHERHAERLREEAAELLGGADP